MAKRIVLAGGSGFLGQALAKSFLAEGCEVHVLSRDPQAGAPASQNLVGTVVPWDGASIGPWAASLEDAAAVINLAGKNINCRLTRANRLDIAASRVFATQAVCEAVAQCRRPPRVFVQTTAVGIYGDAGDAVCDESTPAGGGFLGATCKEWEKAFEDSPTPGIRRVVLRLGVVLGPAGGAFPPLVQLARWFLGGAAGSGRQYISWLHLDDAVRIYRAAINGDDFQGVYVAAAPQPVTNAEFMRTLRAVLRRPWSPPVPAVAVRIGGWLMDINAELVLTGQRCLPRRLLEQGFTFQFGELGTALRELSTQYTVPST